MNFGCRFEPSRHSRGIVSPTSGFAKRFATSSVIFVQVDPRHRRHARNDLFGLELFEEAANERVRHSLVDIVDSKKAPGIGDDGVPAVQDANLHQFERGDIGREGHADSLEFGTA